MRKSRSKTIACMALAGGVTVPGFAQVQPDAGSVLREQTQPRLAIPPKDPPRIKLDEPARPALKPSNERFVLQRFIFTANAVFPDEVLRALVAQYEGREVGFADLEAATARITQYYRDRGYMLARVYLPAQDIRNGVVEIAVLEGRYGKVEVQNTTRVSDRVIRRHLDQHTVPGAVVYALRLDRELLLLSDLPGVAVAQSVLRPGAQVGETDIRIELKAAPLISGALEFDNHGNRFTGPHRVSGQISVASPLGLGDQVSARVIKGFSGLDYGRLGYTVPVGGDGFKVGGAYTASRYKLSGAVFNAAGIHGDSRTVGVNASYPLLRGPAANVLVQLAYDWREFDDRTTATGALNEKNTRVAAATLSGDVRDSVLGGGVSVFSVTYNAGAVDIRSAAQLATDAVTARTHGHFDKWSVNLLRLQTLTQNTQLFAAMAAQKAGKNLDSSEKFVLGGAQGVRAYPQGEATGDSGYLATAELRHTLSLASVPGTVQPFVFADAGGVTINNTPFIAGSNQRHLAGAGVGVNWSRANDFQIKLTVATRLGNQPATASDSDRRTRGWLHLIKQF